MVYWPSMNADIERIVKNCELCIKYQNNQQREPMISHTILNERFLKVGIDIMTFQVKDYLVTIIILNIPSYNVYLIKQLLLYMNK